MQINSWLKSVVSSNQIRSNRARRRAFQKNSESKTDYQTLEQRQMLAGVELGSLIDVGDYYWGRGETIELQRIANERIVELADPSQFDLLFDESDLVTRIGNNQFVVTSDLEFSLSPNVNWEGEVFFDPEAQTRLVVSNELVVALDGSQSAEDVFAEEYGFQSFRGLSGTEDQFVVTLEVGGAATLESALETADLGGVAWAVPNFYQDWQVLSNDPLYSNQWHLENTGQFDAKVDADADVPEAWATGITGSSDVVVAVFDTGVDSSHPDLNMWVNPGEIAGNGVDDDGNGWIDDINGWDFFSNDNNPNPASTGQNHGTAVAGVIAARGDNNLGVTGVSQNSRIMDIKIFGPGYAGEAQVAEGVYYAAGRTQDGTGTWKSADIANHSWGGGGNAASRPTLSAAFDWAEESGREGLGQASFVATGNSANNNNRDSYVGYNFSTTTSSASTWAWVISYEKDGASTAGDDTLRLAQFRNPDGSITRFDDVAAPAGWNLNPALPVAGSGWAMEDNQARAYGTSRYQAKASAIGNNQNAYIMSPTFTSSSSASTNFAGQAWLARSSHTSDIVRISLFDVTNNTLTSIGTVDGFNPSRNNAISFPANLDSTIAVGASTDFDYRSNYSQFGTGLDFVAPSGGGFRGISTTDISGSPGYDSGATDTYNSTGSVTILDSSTITSEIEVSRLGAVGDINVTVDITHEWQTDLDVFLISPDGTRVELFTDVGTSGPGLFSNTKLDDEAATTINSGSSPFSGSYQPEGSLSDFDNERTNGTWTLEITDDAGGDVGTLSSWSLEIMDDGNYADSFGGTSSATPLSAGIGALLLSKNFDLSPAEIRRIMQDSAEQIGGAGIAYDTTTGWNQFYGHGRVNAFNALALTPSDTTVTLNNGILTITDTGNNGISDDQFTISYLAGVYRINEANLNLDSTIAGVTGNGTNNLTIPDTGVTGLVINTLGGDDSITIDSVQPGLESLTVMSGTGDDAVSINGDITFATDGFLHVDLTNGSSIEDKDTFTMTTGSEVELSGAGTATIRTNGEVRFESTSSLTVENGNLTIDGNLGRANYHAEDTPIPTIDNGTIISDLTIADSGLIEDLNVTIDIDHVYNAALDVFLIHPDGTRVELFTDVGSSSDNFNTTTLDDEAQLSINAGAAPFTGVFRPEGDLSVLNGKDISGTWKLEVTDDDGLGDVGVLKSWSLNFLTDSPVPGTGRVGIETSGATLESTGSGDILLTGRGGSSNSTSGQQGLLLNESTIQSTSTNPDAGSIFVNGTGGTGTNTNWGISIFESTVSAVEGDIELEGRGVGSTAGNWGVVLNATSPRTVVTSTNGDVTVNGIGGIGSSSSGIYVGAANVTAGGLLALNGSAEAGNPSVRFRTSSITSAQNIEVVGDDIAIEGSASIVTGGTVSLNPMTNGHGIDLGTETAGSLGLTDAELDQITAGLVQIGDVNSGMITVSAPITHENDLSLTTGGGMDVNEAITMALNRDFMAASTSTTDGIELLTVTADISTTGTGTIGVAAARNILLNTDSSITVENGNLMLSANQQATPTSGNFAGIDVNGGLVESTGTGEVSVLGRGGDTNGDNLGVGVNSDGDIVGGTSGAMTVIGTGGAGDGTFNIGVHVSSSGSTITSSGANVTVMGTGGGSASSDQYNYGVALFSEGQIFASGSAALVVDGISGNSNSGATWGTGVIVVNTGSRIGSENGNLTITGTAFGEADRTAGIIVHFAGEVSATGTGDITLTGTGSSTSTSSESHGVWLGAFAASEISSNTGDIFINGTAGAGAFGFKMGNFASTLTATNGSITIEADSIDIQPAASISAGATVALFPETNGTAIDLGGADVLGSVLGLTDAELDRVTAAIIEIGTASNSGAINVSAPITLASGAILGLGSVNNVNPTASGVDIDLGSGILAFAPGADLNIVIDGTTVDTQYDQLGIAGQISLTAGVNLQVSGSYTPTAGEQYVIVNNDSTDPIVGTFNGLPEGATLTVNGMSATISYLGIDGVSGNDAVLTIGAVASAEVKDQFVFYNDSSFDDGLDAAIAPDKQALLPGGVATFANYTSYSRGINGMMIDAAGLESTPTLATISSFLDFRVGNDNTPGDWTVATAPIDLVVRAGAGTDGSDRIELVWQDNAIEKSWLQVTMLANGSTGLAAPYVFYFGNAVGETGDDPANALVNLADVSETRNNQSGFGTADIDDFYDFDRNGVANLADVSIARTNQSGFTPLRLIDLTNPKNRFGGGDDSGGKPVANKLSGDSADEGGITGLRSGLGLIGGFDLETNLNGEPNLSAKLNINPGMSDFASKWDWSPESSLTANPPVMARSMDANQPQSLAVQVSSNERVDRDDAFASYFRSQDAGHNGDSQLSETSDGFDLFAETVSDFAAF